MNTCKASPTRTTLVPHSPTSLSLSLISSKIQKFSLSLSLLYSWLLLFLSHTSLHFSSHVNFLQNTTNKPHTTLLLLSHLSQSQNLDFFTHTQAQTQTLTETVFLERESKAPIQTTIGGLLQSKGSSQKFKSELGSER